jgi:hypothetical protein
MRGGGYLSLMIDPAREACLREQVLWNASQYNSAVSDLHQRDGCVQRQQGLVLLILLLLLMLKQQVHVV